MLSVKPLSTICLILAFNQTAHNRPLQLQNTSLMCRLLETWIAKIQEALSSLDKMGQALRHQKGHANYVDLATYQERMKRIIGKAMTKKDLFYKDVEDAGRVKARSA